MKDDFQPISDAPVLVIGGSGVDIVGRLKHELHLGVSNPALIRTSFGGVARNVAENLARLGQYVYLITVVGEDQSGGSLLNQLASTGVDTRAVIQTSEHPTGSYIGIVDEKGVMQFALDDMRAMNALSPDHVRQNIDLFESAGLLFIDANLSKQTLRTVVSLARKAGLKVCADPTSANLAERLRPYLGKFHLLTPNSNEAAVLCERSLNGTNPQQALEAAKYLVGKGVDLALITMAEFGVCYATSETSGYIPAVRTEILDPTGAGDALTATVLFAMMNEIPLDDAIRLGVTAASFTLRHRGTVLPDLSLEKLYDHLLV